MVVGREEEGREKEKEKEREKGRGERLKVGGNVVGGRKMRRKDGRGWLWGVWGGRGVRKKKMRTGMRIASSKAGKKRKREKHASKGLGTGRNEWKRKHTHHFHSKNLW